ncbi:MAG: hypothetical protein LBU70_06070 [Chitinispirillales bacterium]|jgi:hypothetical protein|nr:hypothetical protein [Chitinispirillales bacterium]
MITQLVLAAITLFALFTLFLVISKTTSVIDNSLYKLEYMVRKVCDIRLEDLEFRYKIKAADKAFEERYRPHIKEIQGDIRKAVDSNE